MILKIFVKVDKNQKHAEENSVNEFFESENIAITPPSANGNMAKYTVMMKDMNEYVPVSGEINLDTHGYELRNANNIVVERLITRKNL